jgi:hypothetical protein
MITMELIIKFLKSKEKDIFKMMIRFINNMESELIYRIFNVIL